MSACLLRPASYTPQMSRVQTIAACSLAPCVHALTGFVTPNVIRFSVLMICHAGSAVQLCAVGITASGISAEGCTGSDLDSSGRNGPQSARSYRQLLCRHGPAMGL